MVTADVERRTSRARIAVSAMFLTNGAIFANLVPRFPEIKTELAMSNTTYGIVVAAFPVGALVAGLAAGAVIRKLTSARAGLVCTVGIALLVFAAGLSTTSVLLAALLFVGGACDAITDVAQNTHGLRVQREYGRSIINSLHAIWSLGATAGGLIGTWGAANGIALQTQLLVNGAVWSLVAIVAAILAEAPHVSREMHVSEAGAATDGETKVPGPRPWRLLAPLVILAISGTLLEEFGSSWSALFVLRETDAPAALAGLGFTVMLASQFVGRMLGDPMTDRWGRDAVARSGGVLITLGVLLAMFGTGCPWAFAGFALIGFGCATLVPAAFAAAARVPGLPHGTGIAILGWLMRLGFLVTSPVIGAISDAASLRVALVVPLGAGVVAAAIAHALARRSRAR